MSAAEELNAALQDVAAQLDEALRIVTAAQDQWDHRETALGILQGTNDPDAAELVEGHPVIGELMLDVWQLVQQARHLIDTYRTYLGIEATVGSAGPNIPHPSTSGRVPSEASQDRRWVDRVRDRLPSHTGGQTTGLVYDRDGNELRLTSGRDADVSERVRLSLHNSTVFPPTDDRGPPAVFTHVEAKYAQMMRDTGQTHGTVVLNSDMCRGDWNCATAVRAILPRGSVLTVWPPGRSEPIEIHGEATP